MEKASQNEEFEQCLLSRCLDVKCFYSDSYNTGEAIWSIYIFGDTCGDFFLLSQDGHVYLFLRVQERADHVCSLIVNDPVQKKKPLGAFCHTHTATGVVLLPGKFKPFQWVLSVYKLSV